ncbi:MAG: exodeoxyribonuclease VII large subunit [Desulfovibrionaceae bacterium]|nr:exodeoxyribonuclease VII large subunit [Desulfovibrionaceae bacterium]MBF0513103.1 exodeoxyribonuclease VII large subunit [Desulfovibrionaceae bacterium]
MPHIFEVRDLARALKNVLEGQFPFVFVRGQVSNLSKPASGHIYFTLKDDEAALAVVWFKGSRAATGGGFDPVTGEVFEDGGAGGAGRALELADGQEALCGGRITYYPPRGTCQLVAEVVQDLGQGQLYLRFEALRRELAAKGYFDASRKRALPYHPARAAVVTSPTGAAVRDFIRVARVRGYGCEVRVYPTPVQGEAAPAAIASAIEAANAGGWADILVLIRGGGSIEDLWAFNTLEVAEAIFRSRLPVICGVGHEVDTTIADLVADVRAATPSHAAQIVWPERETLIQTVDEAETALTRAAGIWLALKSQSLSRLETRLAWLSPQARLSRLAETLTSLSGRLHAAFQRTLSDSERILANLETRLAARFSPEALAARARALDALTRELAKAMAHFLLAKQSGLDLLEARLTALNPHGPLARGYSLVTVSRTGKLLRGPAEVEPGDALAIDAKHGRVTAVVAPDA